MFLRPFVACHVFTSCVFSTTFSSVNCIHCVCHPQKCCQNLLIHSLYSLRSMCLLPHGHTGVGNTFSSVNTGSSRPSALVEQTPVNSEWHTQVQTRNKCHWFNTHTLGQIQQTHNKYHWLNTHTHLVKYNTFNQHHLLRFWRMVGTPKAACSTRQYIRDQYVTSEHSVSQLVICLSHDSNYWFMNVSDAKKGSNFLFSVSLLFTGIERQGFSCHLSHNMASVYNWPVIEDHLTEHARSSPTKIANQHFCG